MKFPFLVLLSAMPMQMYAVELPGENTQTSVKRLRGKGTKNSSITAQRRLSEKTSKDSKSAVFSLPECLLRSQDVGLNGTALTMRSVLPLDDAVQMDASQVDNFDPAVLSFLSLRFCRAPDPSVSFSPCDISLHTTVEVTPEGEIFQGIDPYATGKGKNTKGEDVTIRNNIRLSQSLFYAFWIPLASFGDADLQIDFFVANKLIRSVVHNTTEIGGKSSKAGDKGSGYNDIMPLKFSVESHPSIRARILAEQGYQSNTIATQLMCEFYASGGLASNILYNENFGPKDTATAMKYSYEASAQEYAGFGFDAEISAVFIAKGIINSCIYDINDAEDVGRVLKNAGYGASDVYEVFKTLFNMNTFEAEDVLLKIGFSEDEAFQAILPDLITNYNELIAIHGPRVYLHPDESYQMSSIDWFFENTRLYYEKNGETLIYDSADITKSNVRELELMLIEEGATEVWLSTEENEGEITGNLDDSPISAGDQATAKAYVKATRIEQSHEVDLCFWLWYPYNGPGTMKFKVDFDSTLTKKKTIQNSPKIANVAPLGEHPSDWEQVILRFNEDNELIKITCSAHGHYTAYNPTDVEKTADGRAKVYTALNGHALFAESGPNYHFEVDEKKKLFDEGELELFVDASIQTGNYCEESSDYLECNSSFELFGIDNYLMEEDGTENPNLWPAYTGKWGADYDFDLSESEKGGIIDRVLDDKVKVEEVIATLLEEIVSLACAVIAAPCIGIFGVGYVACFEGCLKKLGGPSATLILAAWNTLFNKLKALALDSAYPDQIGTAKQGPGPYRGPEYQWIQAVNEDPKYIEMSEFKDVKFISGEADVTINVASHFKKEQPFLDGVGDEKYTSKDLAAPELIKYAIDIERVELLIDDVIYDITDNVNILPANDEGIIISEYAFKWKTSDFANGEYTLDYRVIGRDGRTYKYSDSDEKHTVCNGKCLWLESFETVPAPKVFLDGSTSTVELDEGSTLELDLLFSASRNTSVAEIDWGDGSQINPVPIANDGTNEESIEHLYKDNGLFDITFRAIDGSDSVIETMRLIVNNVAPTIQTVDLEPTNPSDKSVSFDLTVASMDPGLLDNGALTTVVTWGDGTVNTDSTHTYSSAGVYKVEATVTDLHGASSTSRADTFAVVYDTADFYVAASGTVNVPVIISNTTSISSAVFGMVYSGTTKEFIYATDGIAFSSSNLDSLTANSEEAEIRGTGQFDNSYVLTDAYPFLVKFKDDTFEFTVFNATNPAEFIYETEVQDIANGKVVLSSDNIAKRVGKTAERSIDFFGWNRN